MREEFPRQPNLMEEIMAWTCPKIEELCVGMEINMYFPPEV